ncbi:probable elongator complex protein 2 [Zootermopsis nevadensis]|uniref:Elongator complex protein 2 n=1 Tax=Zootermopsis nevadensis TaxID=136037 RepID=A0A067QSM5_ZOONE|nr:probable elongator complex protein 2 [Zootermopsis nevadensis]KDR08420.1 putative elongator complex protein 2 [Zootermopsis nevadensis]
MEQFEIVYVSSACNRTPHNADWGTNELICYGASHSVALYDPKYADAGKVLSVFCQHKGRVNSVRWIRHKDRFPETEFVSASSDCTAVIWTRTYGCNFSPTSILKGHQNTVTVADGIYVSSRNVDSTKQAAIIATASVDSTVKIWIRHENEDAVCLQTLSFGSGFCLCVRLCFLPQTEIVLLSCAADDAKIHLFAESSSGYTCCDVQEGLKPHTKQFIKVDSLVGHDDWIRAMDFTLDDSDHLLLASSSQDSLIRLWRIAACDEKVARQKRKLISELDLEEDIQPEQKFFMVQDDREAVLYFSVSLESILAGHEGWVYGVDWHPPVYSEDKKRCTQPMKLLSSSLDKTMIIWEPDVSSGVWLESVRVGEVGGNTLGFYGSKFGPDGQSIIGHGYQGSFHLWTCSKELGIWEPGVTVGGHFSEVVDMQWEPGGQFLFSISADQTTRIHAPWVRDDHREVTWHELARPQVHGYDFSCLAVLSRYRFASGAEEKVIRAFQAPNNFVELFQQICKAECDKDFENTDASTLPQGASVPALGLSNKAVYEGQEKPAEGHIRDEYSEFYFTPVDLKEPPTEENLLQNTLWPEVQKLYGHGYELFALAASHDGTLLASACKATTVEHATIIIWDTSTWKQIQKLVSHQLTVTQMAFSPDDRFLLSVSRDRRWSLFQLKVPELESKNYRLIASTDKKTGVHARIIWCCSWTHDSKHFFTGSRDGKVAVWGHNGVTSETTSLLGQYTLSSKPLELQNQSVTALAVAPVNFAPNVYLVAVGLESGCINLYKWSSVIGETAGDWQTCLELDNSVAHHLAVKKLAFRPLVAFGDGCDVSNLKKLQMSSCGADHAVKIFNIHVNRL